MVGEIDWIIFRIAIFFQPSARIENPDDSSLSMILIAPDKFKGSLTAPQAAELIADALRLCGFEDLMLVPMADGGEGTPRSLGGRSVILSSDFAGFGSTSLAGKSLMGRSSFPLGREILRHGSEPIYIAIGGTATSDGGAGLLQALGARFFGPQGEILRPITPADLPSLVRIDTSGLAHPELTGLSDVRAALLPPGLSALDFARQKGASDADMKMLEAGLRRLAELLPDSPPGPHAGAGGGIGYALESVLKAPVADGAVAVLEAQHIPWQRVSLIITGEGRIDAQTAGGKVVKALTDKARQLAVPVIAIGGYVEPHLRSRNVVSTIDSPDEYDPALAASRLHGAALKIANNLGR